jgi:secondary thiamine-phosphate synthase enzyme
MINTARLISFSTQGRDEMHDITAEARTFVADSGLVQGQLTVFVPGATASVTTIEMEPGLMQDLPRLLEALIPMKKAWQHNQTWGDDNGGSHLRASLIGPSLTIPVMDGGLTLGTWQQIIVIDHDVRPRKRQVVLQALGSSGRH